VSGLSLQICEPHHCMCVGVNVATDSFHNLYAQIAGYKRFVLFAPSTALSPSASSAPSSAPSLYLHSWLHPSARQCRAIHSASASASASAAPSESPAARRVWSVVLAPGEVLYLPPYWFHYVTALPSASASASSSESAASDSALPFSVSVNVWSESHPLFAAEQALNAPLPLEAEWHPHTTTISVLRRYLCEVIESVEREMKHHFPSALTDAWSCERFVTELVTSRWSPPTPASASASTSASAAVSAASSAALCSRSRLPAAMLEACTIPVVPAPSASASASASAFPPQSIAAADSASLSAAYRAKITRYAQSLAQVFVTALRTHTQTHPNSQPSAAAHSDSEAQAIARLLVMNYSEQVLSDVTVGGAEHVCALFAHCSWQHM
jgi:hypothetical protein